MHLHPLTLALLQTLHANGLELSPHLKTAFEKLSAEHPSGIAPEQMETPMMRQFKDAKEAAPDGLLFFRMGDFYELFGADAVIAAEVCQLTLTSRDRNSNNPVPMAGVPVVNHRSTLKKALAAGFKVVVCDQLEDPKLAKGLVKRDIVRIATPAVPGDLGEDEENASPSGTWLACAVPSQNGTWTLAFVDVSTGTFRFTGRLSFADLKQELVTLNPREIIVPSNWVEKLTEFTHSHFTLIPRVTQLPGWVLRSQSDTLRLFEDFFPLPKLNAFGLSAVDGATQAVAGVLSYLKETQRGVVQNLTSIDYYDVSKHLILDDSTKRHLDFFVTSTGERKGSLFQFLNQTATACGARTLAHKLNYPDRSKEQVQQSHESVACLLSTSGAERELLNLLRTFIDIERTLSRCAQSSVDPKGLAWLGQTLSSFNVLQQLLQPHIPNALGWSNVAAQLTEAANAAEPLTLHLNKALEEEPAQMVGKGGRIFRMGYHAELDEISELEANFESKINELEQLERQNSGISNLKIGYTRAFGYYFEISKGKLAQVPKHFERKQTLVNGERYITPLLKDLEEKSLNAAERKVAIERQLLEQLRLEVVAHAHALTTAAKAIAQIDLWRCFAQLASENRWCRPTIVNENFTALEQCTHPILSALKTTQSNFIANDIILGNPSSVPEGCFGHNTSAGRILLVTGPNMAGKSTVMRQAALAHILAQMGSYVPARSATLGLCDKIFTRIGSGDFALRNQSTFMVEMLETAQMLRFATPASLLLLDEIGRGTSTFDGLSLAWAILEDLADRVGSRALFSTHYHELVDAIESRNSIVPMRMEVLEQTSETGEKIVFTYRFIQGAAGKSYGIHVAQLAGIPDHVVDRARALLAHLSDSDQTADRNRRATKELPDTGLSESIMRSQPGAAASRGQVESDERLRTFLKSIDPNELTPRDALELVFDLIKAAQTSPREEPSSLEPTRRSARKKQWQTSDLPMLF